MVKNNRIIGILFGIIVGIAWGLDGVLMGEVGRSPIYNDFELSPLVTALFHDGFCFVWVSLVLICTKQWKHVFYLLAKTKKGKAVALAGIVGAPIGMSAYLLGIKYAGVSYASSISVIYPGIGAILAYFVLKEKLSKRAILGISISLIGSFMLGFNPSGDVPETFNQGILYAGVAVIGWACEGVIIGFAMKHIKDEDHISATPQQFLCLRYLISLISYCIIVPVIGGMDVATEIIQTGLVINYAGIAILGAITYLSWYKAVDLVGAALGTALNSTSCLWAMIFGSLLFGATITRTLAFWGFIIVLGVFIFAIDPSMFQKKQEHSE